MGALLYTIRRELKTPDEIPRESGIPREDVERKLWQLVYARRVSVSGPAHDVAVPSCDRLGCRAVQG